MWISDGWDKQKGRTVSIEVTEKLASLRSKFQLIEVYQTKSVGKVLLLDGVIMLTEFDEFAYHEMIAHVPLAAHPNPKKILIIGGGDGGTVREVIKHNVDEVHVCEIDEEVIKISKKYFPNLANSFLDPRVKIFYEDGAKFVRDKKEAYDIIIVDSSDPIGPAEILFKEEFYKSVYSSLKEDGIVVSQMESIYYDLDIIYNVITNNKKIFPIVKYYYTLVPTYPSGNIGFCFCSKKYNPEEFRELDITGLKYYNSKIHKASFVLPNFAKEKLNL